MMGAMRTFSDDRGFTLVEVLAAMLVLAAGAIGMAELVALTAVSTRSARAVTSESILALDKLEQLRSLTWGYDATGTPVSDTTTDLSVQPPTNAGAGLGASPIDSLDRNLAGYADFLDAGGRWVGAGTAPPPTAAFVRRWNISPLPANPDVLILQVLVTTIGHARSPQDAVMTTVKSRSAA